MHSCQTSEAKISNLSGEKNNQNTMVLYVLLRTTQKGSERCCNTTFEGKDIGMAGSSVYMDLHM